jgi:hypothetical protein
MAFAVYTIVAVAAVLVAGWFLYVAMTPGPLSPAELTVALIPSLSILGMGAGIVVAAVIVAAIVRAIRRR